MHLNHVWLPQDFEQIDQDMSLLLALLPSSLMSGFTTLIEGAVNDT